MHSDCRCTGNADRPTIYLPYSISGLTDNVVDGMALLCRLAVGIGSSRVFVRWSLMRAEDMTEFEDIDSVVELTQS